MKKILAIILALTLCFALTACGKDEIKDDTHDNKEDVAELIDDSKTGTEQEVEPVDESNTESEPENIVEPVEESRTETEQDVTPNVPSDVMKATYKDDNLNEVTLYQNNEESYGMVISLYRLTQIEGDANIDGDGFILSGIDAAGEPITLRFYPSIDSYILEVKESTWELLPVGEMFEGFKPVIKGEQ